MKNLITIFIFCLSGLFVVAQESNMSSNTVRDSDGRTPLHEVAKWGQTEIAISLIEDGAEVNAQDKEGRTPLHEAGEWGQIDTAIALLEAGANPKAQDNQGRTPLSEVEQWGPTETAIALLLDFALEQEKTEAIRVLQELEAEINTQNQPQNLSNRSCRDLF